MADLLSEGESLIAEMSAEHLSEPVVYARGSDSFSVSATIGSRTFEREQADGAAITYETTDFIFRVSQFALTEPGAVQLPRRGDTITRASGGVYEILPELGRDAWGYTDPSNTSFRISTKKVG